MNSFLSFSEEVQKANELHKPILALESTIISHGMPYPQNVETALKVEQIARDNGAVPATIAIIDGKLKVGLSEEEVDFLGKNGPDVMKCSRRDIPYVLSKNLPGATTVAATMYIAAEAGISVFATGGIGGVHRGAETTFDISADLEELSKTSVAVVCAGAKSILDIGLTLEYLETKGVPVLGYETQEMPAFYTRSSGFNLDFKMDSVEELSNFIDTKWQSGLHGGIVVANPIPKSDEADAQIITDAITKALQEMESKGIKGKESTPFLLARVSELTKGKSLESNIKLVFNNVKLGAKIAAQLKN